MFNLLSTHLHVLFIISILLSAWIVPASAARKSYIVYMGEHAKGIQLTKALLHSRTDFHIEFLGSILGCTKKAKEAMFYSYRRHINGFAAELEENEVFAIQNNPMVVSVFPNEEQELQTSHSWDFLALESTGFVPASSLWEKAKFGEDIIIANFDSGAWPESASFKDEGYGPIPSRWKGRCEDDQGSPFPCNKKLIGAKYFYEGFVRRTGFKNLTIDSPRDYDGHGTHTLSTAGGDFVPGASVLGLYNGTTKGGSPKARVAAYKVCWPNNNGIGRCMDADILKAFDHAIDDGVDVISISISGPYNYYSSGTAIGAFSAVKKGITVIASAGNKGPEYGSVANVAPWLITVAASTTDRDIVVNVQLHNGVHLKGKSISKSLPEIKFYTLIGGADAKFANASDKDSWACLPSALDPKKVKGNIVVCFMGDDIEPIEMGKHAALAGAAGMILCNNEANGDQLSAEADFLPTAQISYTDSLTILNYVNNTKNPQGLITHTKAEINIRPAPMMASFSSRGPNTLTPEILKPDITAPGVEIMAAYTEGKGPTGFDYDKRRTPYTFMSGTSMACPHVSGVVGLLKVLHPQWSPAAIRSALMTTASTSDNTHGKIMMDDSSTVATPLNYGAGHIRPDLAADPGLVYDLNTKDYENFLCAIGYNETLRNLFTKVKTCSSFDTPSLLNFNYPSISVPKLNGSVTVNRSLKNVGSPGIYVAKISEPLGVSVSVQPSVLRFTKTNEIKRFKLIMTRNSMRLDNTHVFGQLLWWDGRHTVKSPIVVGTS